MAASETLNTLRYTTLAELRQALRAPTNSGASSWREGGEWDETLIRQGTAVEASIDGLCGRRFDVAATEPVTRAYVCQHGAVELITHDFVAGSTTAVTDSGGNVLGRWVELPENISTGTSIGLDLTTQTSLGGRFSVTARFGFPSIPAQITEAVCLATARIFNRYSTPQGLMVVDGGVAYVSSQDRDVARLLAPLRRLAAAT